MVRASSFTTLLLPACLMLSSCRTGLFSSLDFEDLNQARASDQAHFEDSTKVFFATYTNPYPDREFLWFATFLEGPVEMRIYEVESDSLQAVYRFEKQETALHTVAMHQVRDHFVKCVLYINGHRKCAKIYPSFTPIQIPHWETKYSIEIP